MVNTLVTLTGEFHQQWCNSFPPPKSYVNEGLQHPQNVLLLGPFKKVFQRLTEPVFS
jgi:hypothetical protein